MKTRILTFGALGSLIAGIGLLLASDDAQEGAIRNDRALYQGSWKVIALEADGTKMSEEDFAKVTVVNELDGRWIVKVEGGVIWQGLSSIDTTKYPKTIDFRPTKGADVGKLHLGIYEINKDVRRLCYAEPGKERPTEFATSPASGRVLLIFKREKGIGLLTIQK